MDKRPLRVVEIVLAIAGCVVGYKFLGLNFLIPALSLCGCWLAFRQAGVHPYLSTPLTFVVAQGIWVLVGLATGQVFGGTRAILLQVVPDILAIIGLVAWVLARRSKASLYGLIVYEVLSLLVHVSAVVLQHKLNLQMMLAVHIATRCVVILSAAVAVRHHKEFAKPS